jgi:hypothetical protein
MNRPSMAAAKVSERETAARRFQFMDIGTLNLKIQNKQRAKL